MTQVPPLTYLSFDGLGQGVGFSQVLPYVERLAALGLDVTVHSFEPAGDQTAVAARLQRAGITWRRHAFGRAGAIGGVGRVLRAAWAVRHAGLVHARSDLAGAAVMLSRRRRWIWDVRSLWRDQRIELGMLQPGSLEERTLRLIERQAARSASGLVTLTAAVIPVLEARHGPAVTSLRQVIATCADLDRFPTTPLPPRPPVRLLLSGSLNRYYDVPAMLRFVQAVDRLETAELAVLSPGETAWEADLAAAGIDRGSASPEDMPARVQASHAGLSICRSDLGDSLRAAMPTKLGEFLASGRPVVVSPGLGDMDALVRRYRCGAVVEADGDMAAAAEELLELLADTDLPDRCRALAEAHFDVDEGARKLLQLYEEVSRA